MYQVSANSDLQLTAKAVKFDTFTYTKINNIWRPCKALYKKENGVWVKQNSPLTGYEKLYKRHNPWTFNKGLRQNSTLVDESGVILTEYIPVTPGVQCIIQGQGSTDTNTLWHAFDNHKVYYDYWGASGTKITTIGGRVVYSRTMSASDMANTYYVRVGALREAWNYIKVTQNGVVIFDGSNFPYN